jgi:hypothetical protein
MGASKKLWEEIYCGESPNWINQSHDLYPEKQEETEEKLKILNTEINENIQIVSS